MNDRETISLLFAIMDNLIQSNPELLKELKKTKDFYKEDFFAIGNDVTISCKMAIDYLLNK